jgi:uncharacterized protein DUF2442
MSTAIQTDARIVSVDVTDQAIIARLGDGRIVSVPLAWSWRLSDATAQERARWEIIGDGQGVHWPDVDEDISLEGMLRGVPAKRRLRLDVKPDAQGGQEQPRGVSSEAARIRLELVLDPVSANDRDLVGGVLNAFPPELRPDVSTRLLFAEPAALNPLFVLAVTVLGWGGRKVLGPALDEVGLYLKNALKAFLERGRDAPDAIRMDLRGADLEVQVSMETKPLLGWEAPAGRFSELRQFLADIANDPALDGADKLLVFWNAESKHWEPQQVWPKDMRKMGIYLSYDPKTGKWETKPL